MGEYRGFDKLSRQMLHPWGQVGCQIPTMSPGPRGFDSTFMLSTSLLFRECDSMPLKATATKFEKLQPQCQLLNVKSPPGVWGRPGWGQVHSKKSS